MNRERGAWDRWQKITHLIDKWRWHPTPVLLPGKSHGWRSLVGCSPWGRWELDTTERLHFHFSLSCIGEGNGNPLQCSCLENPRDGEPGGCRRWVAQSRTRLKWLSSCIDKWDPWADRRKQESSEWQETTHFGVISVLETNKRKVGKDRNLLHLHITCCSLCFYYNKISLADEKYPSCTTTMTLLIKAIKDKIPSALRSRDENQERGPPNSFPNE